MSQNHKSSGCGALLGKWLLILCVVMSILNAISDGGVTDFLEDIFPRSSSPEISEGPSTGESVILADEEDLDYIVADGERPHEDISKLTDTQKEQLSARLPHMPQDLVGHRLLLARDIGLCRRMTGLQALSVVFVEDETSHWSEEEKNEWRQTLQTAVQDMTADAAQHGADLSFTLYEYTVYPTASYDRNNHFEWAKNALQGTGLVWDDPGSFKARGSAEGYPILFLRKDRGRSFAGQVSGYAPSTRMEYAVIFDPARAGTIKHELYHLYGAEDFYHPYDLAEMTRGFFPESIMLSSSDEYKVDDLSAYLIGWTDSFHEGVQDYLYETLYLTTSYLRESYKENTVTGQVTDHRTGNATYTGGMENGFMNGYGIWIHDNGNRYEGDFSFGLFEGQGKMTYADGSVYEGEWHESARQGRGKMVFSDGAVYEGQWHNHKFHGQGTLNYPNGTRYEGAWQNHERSGYGVMYYDNGASYEGEWQSNDRNGYGVMRYDNGDVYEGEWLNNQRHGQGRYTYPSGKVLDGQWAEGKFIR